ncbi:MAG: hypothetical protein DHS20C21_16220 [Gemmatimonadota bacterium]|nr:MAG: hypothetical protein DHS20C21_16220 [Gemmatimonadota bacterium]
MVGKKLGHYEILEKVGVGGMGEVYRATDSRLDRTVAVKVLPPQFSQDPARRQRFLREAKTISNLQHPNICTMHDLGSHDEVDYIVMEFIEGETLAERLQQGPLPLADVLRYGAEIAQALDRAHRSGVVHRDLKPGNVMITKSGVKLLDFGLAKIGEGTGGAAVAVTQAVTEPHGIGPASGPLTAEGTILGTFHYMAPEQLEGGEADARSDLFALGSVLYEMATGRKAFEGKSQASLIAAILEREPTPLSSVAPMTPPALDHIVRKCMAKDPEDRWQSAADVSGQLSWIAESSSQAGVPAVVSSRRRVRARLAWSIAALATVGMLAMALLWWTGRPTPAPAVRFQIPVPEEIGFARSLRISPDGRTLAIGARNQDSDQIWLRHLNDLAPRVLAGTEGSDLPIWSPDARHIAFFSDRKLRKVSVAGGPAQTLCDAPSGDAGDWSSEGVILFDGSYAEAVSRVSAAGGIPVAAVPLDSVEASQTFGWPALLPDERFFLFIEISSDVFQLFWGDLKTGEKQRIGPVGSRAIYAEPGYVLYVTEHTLVAHPFDAGKREFCGEPIPLAEGLHVNNFGDAHFSVSRNGVLVYRSSGADQESLIWVDRGGTVIEQFGDPVSYEAVSVAGDGRIVTERSSGGSNNVDLWIMDPARGTTSRLTFDPQIDVGPVWSPDGRDVYYTAQEETGGWDIRRRSASGVGDAQTIAHFDLFTRVEDVTNDGGHLILGGFRGDRGMDILLLDQEGGAEAQPFIATPFLEVQGRLSPDGRWLAYASNETGRAEVYIRSFPGGESKWQVSTTGGQNAEWRPDGRELFFINADRELMGASVESSGALSIGTPEVLFPIGWAEAGTREYSVSPDGERFLFIRDLVESDPTPFTVVMNWTSELPAR